MSMTDERKAALLAYCRIDALEEGEDTLIDMLYDAAVSYMRNAGVSEPTDPSRKAQYDLCVNALVLDGYDTRCTTMTGTIIADNPMFRRMLNQLKLTEPDVSNLGTSGPGL